MSTIGAGNGVHIVVSSKRYEVKSKDSMRKSQKGGADLKREREEKIEREKFV